MEKEKRDYAGRPVCANCGHTEQLHKDGTICGAMHCYCKAFKKLAEE